MSRFKADDRGRYVVIGVTFRLRPGGPPAVKYAELSRHFAERGVAAPSLAETRQAVIEVRRRKSMVLDPADPNARSVGSFFMNPVVAGRRVRRRWPRASSRTASRRRRTRSPTTPADRGG